LVRGGQRFAEERLRTLSRQEGQRAPQAFREGAGDLGERQKRNF
jgi:hypothetical protein